MTVAHPSNPDDLVLHATRILGFASEQRIADLFGLAVDQVEELLLDDEAMGWVSHSTFAGSSGWSITARGRSEDETRLAAELELVGARPAVEAEHARFVPLNSRFGQACTDWQLRPTTSDPLAANDHADWRWDDGVFAELDEVGRGFQQVSDRLAALLRRFENYRPRYAAAWERVQAGDRRWIDAVEADSCHTVWIQFHEDLLATLGIPRG